MTDSHIVPHFKGYITLTKEEFKSLDLFDTTKNALHYLKTHTIETDKDWISEGKTIKAISWDPEGIIFLERTV